MSFGKMNAYIEIGVAERVSDEDGFTTEGLNVVAKVKAYREDRHGSQKWANRAAFTSASSSFVFRSIPGIAITTAHIILCGTEQFNIVSVEDVKRRGMYTEVLAEKVVASSG